MTTVLGFDTATASTAVALVTGARELEARDDPEPGARPRHTAQLLAQARGLLERAELSFADVDRNAVGTGPASDASNPITPAETC